MSKSAVSHAAHRARSPGLKPSVFAFALTLAFGAISAHVSAATGPTWDEISNDDQSTDNVLSYGMGLKAWRHSPTAFTSPWVVKTCAGSIFQPWRFSIHHWIAGR